MLKCPTDNAAFLLVSNASSPIRVLAPQDLVANTFRVAPLASIYEQVQERAEMLNAGPVIIEDFRAVFRDQKTTLFLARLKSDPETWSTSWVLFPELLRMLPEDRGRLPYLKAMQFLAGSHKDHIVAVDR